MIVRSYSHSQLTVSVAHTHTHTEKDNDLFKKEENIQIQERFETKKMHHR